MPEFLFEGRTIGAEDGETVLSALLRHGVALDHGCKAGACQRCIVCTKPGEAPGASTKSLDESLVDRGFFLACQADAGAIAEVGFPSEAAYPVMPASLVETKFLSASVMKVRLAVRDLNCRRGQCLRLTSPAGIVRSYSIADCSADAVEFHVRLIAGGAMSSELRSAPMGSCFQVEGPFGKCYFRDGEMKPILLIGSGTGLAPLWGVIQDAVRQGHSAGISLFHGGAASEDLYFRNELLSLVESGKISYVSCADLVTDPRDSEGSPLTHALAKHPDQTGYRVYLCGHPDLVKSGQKQCFLAGANLSDILIDAFEPQSSS